jgi:hypothetical protein
MGNEQPEGSNLSHYVAYPAYTKSVVIRLNTPKTGAKGSYGTKAVNANNMNVATRIDVISNHNIFAGTVRSCTSVMSSTPRIERRA